jgi:predicted nucleic acid-binding protein
MKILIDTNIVLDVLLDRKPFSINSAAFFKLAEQGRIEAYITSNSVTDMVYILRKAYDMDTIKENLLIMFGFIKILNVSASDILKAFEIKTDDYDDAVIIQCASRIEADHIITRDIKGFKNSPVSYLTAEEFIASI